MRKYYKRADEIVLIHCPLSSENESSSRLLNYLGFWNNQWNDTFPSHSRVSEMQCGHQQSWGRAKKCLWDGNLCKVSTALSGDWIDAEANPGRESLPGSICPGKSGEGNFICSTEGQQQRRDQCKQQFLLLHVAVWQGPKQWLKASGKSSIADTIGGIRIIVHFSTWLSLRYC